MLSLVACGVDNAQSEMEAEAALESSTQALQGASNTADAPEVANLFRGSKLFKFNAAEGFRCDDTPDITYVDVCGQQLPATVHLEWTDCAAPARPGRPPLPGSDGGIAGAPPHSGHKADGGSRPPPPPPPPHGGKGGHGHGPRFADGGVPPPPPAGDGGMHGGGPRGHGPSSGLVDLTFSYATPNGCTGAIEQTQTATFDISRTAPDGSVSRNEGTVSSVADLSASGRPEVKSSSVDVSYSLTDAAGTVIRSMDLVGTRNVAFSSDEPPTRTINSSFTETYADGTTGTLTEVDVIRPPMNECPWPTSGTVTRVASDGTTQTLVYGPTCGDGTLNGAPVDLAERRIEKLVRKMLGKGGRR